MTRREPVPGFTVWLTGLSGAGKNTISRLVGAERRRRLPNVGDLPDFTGVSAPYEAPAAPDLELDTEHEGPEACAGHVIALLEARGLLP